MVSGETLKGRGAGGASPENPGGGAAGGAPDGGAAGRRSGVVTVKALGFLARYLPGQEPATIEAPLGREFTVDEVMRLAGLPDEDVYVIIVNGKRGRPEQKVAAGDEVTFVPPVAGG